MANWQRTIVNGVVRRLSGRAALGTLALSGLIIAGCIEEDAAPPADEASSSTEPGLEGLDSERAALITIPELDTFISEYIEIDKLGAGPGDANLFSQAAEPGGDPADGTAHALIPGAGTFIDWDDLGGDLANHRIADDTKLVDGTDRSSFPRKNECVGESTVLTKMDLTYVGIASNPDFVYTMTTRASNDGDAGYMWLFTLLPPDQRDAEAPCSAGETRLLYDITGPGGGGGGDVLLVGHFAPSSTPLLRVFQAKVSRADVVAPAAIDFTDSTLWQEITPTGLTVAVNTTPTDPDSYGSAGIKNLVDGDIDEELFAEAAIPLSVFTGGSSCGASYYASVITRPSGSGGPSPDLKDAIFARANFGNITAGGSLAPTCGTDVYYKAGDIEDTEGNPLTPDTDFTCDWDFYNDSDVLVGSVSSDCEGVYAAGAAGSYYAELTVTLTGGLTCTDTITTNVVSVYDPLSATADLVATCDGAASPYEASFEYSGTTTGGSGSLSYAWLFDSTSCPGCVVDPDSASDLPSAGSPGTVLVDTAGETYRGRLTVTDDGLTGAVDSSGLPTTCTDTADDTAVPLAPIVVSLSLSAGGGECPLASDAATWAALVDGGDGSYTYNWTPASCAGTTCTIDPSDSTFCASETISLEVDDGSALCPAASSETETYGKTTSVTASDN